MLAAFDVEIATDFKRRYDALNECEGQPDCVIISGLTFAQWNELSSLYILTVPSYVRGSGEPGDYLHSAYWKSFIINEIDVDVFFEEDPRQVAILRNTCQHTLIFDCSDEFPNPTT
jgi:hypothetical protein